MENALLVWQIAVGWAVQPASHRHEDWRHPSYTQRFSRTYRGPAGEIDLARIFVLFLLQDALGDLVVFKQPWRI